jgi:UDP-glucose 4-epimerase
MVMEWLKLLITWANWFFWKHLTQKLDKLEIPYLIFEWDLLSIENIDTYFSKNKVNTIIHLAWVFFWDFEKQISLNFKITQNILTIWKKYGLQKIIYTSTWAVYWDSSSDKSIEDDILTPNTDYWFSKKITEELIQYYSTISHIDYVILRYPNVYWPWNEKGVVYHFSESIIKLWKVSIHGDWKQIRDFLYIDDAIESIILSLNYSNNDIFNISSFNTLSLNQLVDSLGKVLNKKPVITYLKWENNLQKLSLDIKKAQLKLKYKPNFNTII